LGLIVLGFLANALPFFFSLIAYRKKPREERVIQQANVSGLNIGCFALSFVQAFFPVSGVVATLPVRCGEFPHEHGGHLGAHARGSS
jgi:predicted permease